MITNFMVLQETLIGFVLGQYRSFDKNALCSIAALEVKLAEMKEAVKTNWGKEDCKPLNEAIRLGQWLKANAADLGMVKGTTAETGHPKFHVFIQNHGEIESLAEQVNCHHAIFTK